MGYIREPKGVDFIVGPSVLTLEDKIAFSNAIAEFRKTGKTPASKNSTSRKSTDSKGSSNGKSIVKV